MDIDIDIAVRPLNLGAVKKWLVTGISLMCAVVVTPVLTAPAARATEPVWSNLDARGFDGPIPRAGTLIASVPLDPALSVAGAERAYRILYSTVDQHDSPAVSTAAVFVPRGRAPEGGWPVIAWAHGTVGLGDDCAPSAQPRSARDNEYLTHWLDQGYAIVGSDYAGLGTPGLMSYLNSVATAHSVVDSVIAMHEMDLPLSPEWGIVGQSQGGGAAVNSARWATEFSHSVRAGTGLDYRGVVATGTPFNVESIVKQAGPDMALPPNLGPAANSYTAYILAGFREARPDVDVDGVLTPAGLDAVAKAETLCKPQLDEALAGMTPTEFFRAPLAALPGVDAALDAYMGTPTSGYDRPIFLGVGMQDRDVPPNLTLQLNDALRANGQNVTLKVYPDEDHSGTVLASVPDSTPFLRAAFDGR